MKNFRRRKSKFTTVAGRCKVVKRFSGRRVVKSGRMCMILGLILRRAGPGRRKTVLLCREIQGKSVNRRRRRVRRKKNFRRRKSKFTTVAGRCKVVKRFSGRRVVKSGRMCMIL